MIVGVSLLALITLIGCQGTTSTGGGGPAGGTFEFKKFVSIGAITLHQGETKEEHLKINRHGDFKETVALDFKDDKKGLTFEPSAKEIKPDNNEIILKIVARDDAEVGKHEVTVTGTPGKGSPGSYKFEVEVKAKKEAGHENPPKPAAFDIKKFLSLPAVTLKQGEAKEEKVNLNREGGFNEPVKLEFKDDKKGLTFEPQEIKADAKEVVIKIHADDKADLGEHEVTVTGTPAKGEKASFTFKVKVEKK
jgi:uncharacterized membrane protein